MLSVFSPRLAALRFKLLAAGSGGGVDQRFLIMSW